MAPGMEAEEADDIWTTRVGRGGRRGNQAASDLDSEGGGEANGAEEDGQRGEEEVVVSSSSFSYSKSRIR